MLIVVNGVRGTWHGARFMEHLVPSYIHALQSIYILLITKPPSKTNNLLPKINMYHPKLSPSTFHRYFQWVFQSLAK